jgi:hypothetical protein
VTRAAPARDFPARARAFDGYVLPVLKAVPATPTHCGCGVELEPLRRYAGLCKRCVATWTQRSRQRQAERPIMQVVRRFARKSVKYVEVECGCKVRRTMREATYRVQRPQCCKRCRLRAVDKNGFEAEYPR